MIHYKIEVQLNSGLFASENDYADSGFNGELNYHDENIEDLREIEKHLKALERYGIFKTVSTSATTDLKL